MDKDERRERRRYNFSALALALVSGVGAGWLLAHPTLFDRTRFQVLHSSDSTYPFPVLFLVSTLLGLFVGSPAVNLLSRNGFSVWSLLPPLLWFGFGVQWIERHIVSSFVGSQIEGLASWGILWIVPYSLFTGFLVWSRRQRRHLVGQCEVAAGGGVWPPPPQIP